MAWVCESGMIQWVVERTVSLHRRDQFSIQFVEERLKQLSQWEVSSSKLHSVRVIVAISAAGERLSGPGMQGALIHWSMHNLKFCLQGQYRRG